MKRSRVFAALAVVTVFLSACGINSIPRAEEEAKAKWAEVQDEYQRRLDTLPNLVDAARAAGPQESRCRSASRRHARATAPARPRPAPRSRRFAAPRRGQQGRLRLIVRATHEQPPNPRRARSAGTCSAGRGDEEPDHRRQPRL